MHSVSTVGKKNQQQIRLQLRNAGRLPPPKRYQTIAKFRSNEQSLIDHGAKNVCPVGRKKIE